MTEPTAKPKTDNQEGRSPAEKSDWTPNRADPRALLAELRAKVDFESAARQGAETWLSQLEKALETMQLGVTITDANGKVMYSNPADAELHGYTVDELIGNDVALLCPRANRRPLNHDQLRILSSWQRESVNIRKDGTEFPVWLHSDIVLGADGEAVAVVTTCEDITERKKAEGELRRAYEELDRRVAERTTELSEANARLREEIAERERTEGERMQLETQLRQAQKMEALGRLAGGIAHDFNNLLTVILANAELVEHSLPPDCVHLQEELHVLEGASMKARDLVKKLLSFGRQQDLSLEPIDPAAVISDLEDVLRRLIPVHIRIELDVGDGTERVSADKTAVEQIIINLATNARDAMPEGGVLRIELRRREVDAAFCLVHPDAAPGEYVCVLVSDTGMGMDDDVRERAFEPFFTTKPPGMGTGLGMAMIYGLMTQQGGFIDVETAKAEGTTVKLYFPLARISSPGIPIPREAAEELPRGSELILLVEDEERLRETGKRILEKFGYRVIMAGDGQEALEALEASEEPVEMVVSDIVMPRMNGYQLRDALRLTGNTVKFLFTTGYAGAEATARGQTDADVPLLRKPWNLSDLVRGVRAVLDTPSDA